MADQSFAPVVALTGVRLSFGTVRALQGVDFRVSPGEVVGLVGHNGAGKSTLMNILAGNLRFDEGRYRIADETVGPAAIPSPASLGVIGSVSQETVLAPNLTVAENARILHRSLVGRGWRQRAARLMQASLDDIFPGHGIRGNDLVGDLPIAKRQMVEIARAFADRDIALMILDEPTSSLDGETSEQLLAYVRKRRNEGLSLVLISHRLGEIFSVGDRAVVMRDGLVVMDRPISELTRDEMVAAMGHGAPATARTARRSRAPAVAEREACISVLSPQLGALGVVVHPGEVIGLAGLAGHGQSRFLRTLVSGRGVANRRDKVAFVAGDRRTDGIFSLWSIQHNLTIRAMDMLETLGFLNPARERRLAQDWRKRIEIRAESVNVPIVTLSGGNQQKVLFARALGSDASIILMDDPMRGVDIGTKQEVYRLIQAEADGGRSFVWYSTEIDELAYCDRVYVFRQGMAVHEFCGDEINENNIVGASFAS